MIFNKGIEFGDEKVRNWLISLIISFLTGILVTQPLKVILMTVFCVAVLRKYDDPQSVENDPDKLDKALNSMNVNPFCFDFLFYFQKFKKKF